MHLFVTGMTGKTGRCFLRVLQREGFAAVDIASCRALCRANSDTGEITACGLPIELADGDLDDVASLKAAMQGMDTVLHIAGIQKSENVVEAALAVGVRWLILVHTTGIYSRYKAAGEGYRQIEQRIAERLEGTGVAMTILRPTMIYGGVDDKNISVFIRMVNRLRVFPTVSGGKFALQPVHREDLGEAYYAVLRHADVTKNRNYDLSGAYPMDLIDILKVFSDELQKKTRFISIPFFFAYAGAWGVYLLSLTKIDLREKVQRLVEPRAYGHEAATRDFGYAPQDLEQGLRREVRDCRAAWETQGREG